MVRSAASFLAALHIYVVWRRAKIPPSFLTLPTNYENYNMSHLFEVTDQQATCLLQRYITRSVDIACGGLLPTITCLWVFQPTSQPVCRLQPLLPRFLLELLPDVYASRTRRVEERRRCGEMRLPRVADASRADCAACKRIWREWWT